MLFKGKEIEALITCINKQNAKRQGNTFPAENIYIFNGFAHLTDGNVIARVPMVEDLDDDFPLGPQEVKTVDPPDGGITIPVTSLQKAIRNLPKSANHPTLQCIQIQLTENAILLNTTDLDSFDTVSIRREASQPNRCPNQEIIYELFYNARHTGGTDSKVHLSHVLLGDILRAFTKAGLDHTGAIEMVIDTPRPAYLCATGECRLEVLIMPKQAPEDSVYWRH